MKMLGSLGGFPVGLAESRRAFGESLLSQSHSLRHEERRYLATTIPKLRSYRSQVLAATRFTLESRSRMRLIYSLFEASAQPDDAFVAMCDKATDELNFLREVLEPVGPEELNLKDLGWTPAWRDPTPDCLAFRNSITEVQLLGETLGVQGLLEYGLVPSDLSESYQEDMRAWGLLTPHSDQVLTAHGGDWRRVVRDLGPEGVCL